MRVEGVNEVAADLGKAAATVTARASEVIRKTAVKIASTAGDLAPVRTGALRKSIKADHRGLSADIGSSVPYAGFVEYGTYKDSPQPFMGPALAHHEGDLVKEMEELGGDV